MNLHIWLAAAEHRLTVAGVEFPALVAGIIAGDRLAIPRLELTMHTTRLLDSGECENLDRLIDRAAKHEPVQYILGTADFMGMRLHVDRRVLIPRPETEQLVELVISLAGQSTASGMAADVGTGSGAIACALAARCKALSVVGIDVSPAALAVAAVNCRALHPGGRITLLCADLLSAFRPASLTLVVANLPYVPTSVWRKLDCNVRDYEPRLALDGGEDGLSLIDPLIRQAAYCLRPGGLLALELDPAQVAPAMSWMNHDFEDVRCVIDLTRRNRFVTAIRCRQSCWSPVNNNA